MYVLSNLHVWTNGLYQPNWMACYVSLKSAVEMVHSLSLAIRCTLHWLSILGKKMRAQHCRFRASLVLQKRPRKLIQWLSYRTMRIDGNILMWRKTDSTGRWVTLPSIFKAKVGGMSRTKPALVNNPRNNNNNSITITQGEMALRNHQNRKISKIITTTFKVPHLSAVRTTCLAP